MSERVWHAYCTDWGRRSRLELRDWQNTHRASLNEETGIDSGAVSIVGNASIFALTPGCRVRFFANRQHRGVSYT